ncbi:MAG: ABC transporter permease [Lachnospiraceae bacterium]
MKNRGIKIFAISKVTELILTLLIVTIISFILMRLSPIDSATAYARRTFTSVNAEDIEKIRAQMGLNRPLVMQYFDWVKSALHLDFGKSLVTGKSVFAEVTSALSITFCIVGVSAVIQVLGIAIVGQLCYLTRKKVVGYLLDFLCISGISIPAFFFASEFIDIFAVKYRLISVAGNEGLMRFLPAAICLAISSIAFFSQLLAKELKNEMESTSAFYARCRGLSESYILRHYALPEAVSRLLPNFMQMLGLCMAGSIIVERVFSLPGLGYSIVDSVLYRDSPMIHATILFLAFSLVIFNLLSDILQRALQGGNTVKEG